MECEPGLFWVFGVDGSTIGLMLFCEEVFRGEAVAFLEFAGRAAEADLTALSAGLWADFDDLVGLLKQVGFVFDKDDGISALDQSVDGFCDALGIGGVKSDGGFIENIEHIDEVGTEEVGKLNALCFTAAEGVHGSGEGEVA